MDFFKFDGYVWQRLSEILCYDVTAPMTLASGFFLFAFFVFGIGYMAVRNRRVARTIYVAEIGRAHV